MDKWKNLIKKLVKNHPNIYLTFLQIYHLKPSYIPFLLKVIIARKIPHNPKEQMVNIGAGEWYKRNWKVMDFKSEWYPYNNFFIDYHYNLTKKEKMPFKDNFIDIFYSEHTFEHISNENCEHTFVEIYRCLKHGGTIRIVVPDMDIIYEKYKRHLDEKFFEDRMNILKLTTLTKAFMSFFAFPKRNENEESIKHRLESVEKTKFLDFYTKNLKQNPKCAGHHINWFNYPKLKRMLENVGFKNIYKSIAQGSKFKEMRGKEFDTLPLLSLHIEAIK